MIHSDLKKGDILKSPSNTKKLPLYNDIKSKEPWFLIPKNTILYITGRPQKKDITSWIPVKLELDDTPLWIKKEHAILCQHKPAQCNENTKQKNHQLKYEQLEVGALCQTPNGLASIVTWDENALPTPEHIARVQVEELNKKHWYWLTQLMEFKNP